MRLDGTPVVVTGGGSGLGAASARWLAGQGARIAVLDLNELGGRAVANDTGGVFLSCDVTSAKEVEAALAGAADLHGTARVVLCCAGIGDTRPTIDANGPHELEAFERVLAVNLTGTFNCLRLAAWAMQDLEPFDDGERGVLVTTSSIAAFDGIDGGVAYAASKGGIAAMTLPLARDLAPWGIRAVSIAPGVFETPLTAGMAPAMVDGLAENTPFPARLGDPAEFAALVEHVVTNRFLNGTVIRLDGAQRLGATRPFHGLPQAPPSSPAPPAEPPPTLPAPSTPATGRRTARPRRRT